MALLLTFEFQHHPRYSFFHLPRDRRCRQLRHERWCRPGCRCRLPDLNRRYPLGAVWNGGSPAGSKWSGFDVWLGVDTICVVNFLIVYMGVECLMSITPIHAYFATNPHFLDFLYTTFISLDLFHLLRNVKVDQRAIGEHFAALCSLAWTISLEDRK